MSAYDTFDLASAPVRISPRLLGLIGERFAMYSSSIQSRMDASGPSASETTRFDLESVERLGLQLQQLTRMIEHGAEAQSEPVDLAAACRQAAAEWHSRIEAAGVSLEVRGESLEATLNAASFELIADLLIEYGVALGQSVAISVSPNMPNQGSVRFEITRRPLAQYERQQGPSDTDEIFPLLATQLARGTGLRIRQSDQGHVVTLVLTVPPLPGEIPAADAGELLPRTMVARGVQILIVDPRSSSRLRAHQLLTAAGMFAEAVETVAQAKAMWRDHEPDLLIVGLSTRERQVIDLIEDIRSSFPALRVIELVDEENAFAFAMPGDDAAGRLSRSEIEIHLVTAVSQELANRVD